MNPGMIVMWLALACSDRGPVLVLETPVTPSSACIAGAIRVDAGEDLNSDGVLDVAEVSASTTRCNSLDFLQGKNRKFLNRAKLLGRLLQYGDQYHLVNSIMLRCRVSMPLCSIFFSKREITSRELLRSSAICW